MPCQTIADNAGVPGAVIVGKLLEETDTSIGYNALVGEYMNMPANGILDPTKVVRTALADAASVAGLMTTTEVMIVDEVDESADAAAGGMPPMGGMG